MTNFYTILSGLGHRTKAFAAVFATIFSLISAQTAFAEANYVYHEQTTNNPGCGPNYMSTTAPTNAAGLQISWKIEYQFYTTNTVVYYTTDGSNPSGAFGVGTGTTQVLTGSYNCTFGGPVVDVATATIPAQPAGTTVKYIISSWHSGGGNEIFANGPGVPCACGTPTSNSSLATVFSYTVSPSATNIVEVVATAGTKLGTYTTLKGAFDAINLGTHQGVININLYGNTTETATASLNASGGAVSYSSVTIAPKTTARTITGSIIGAIIKLNGADNVTIDGRIGGVGNNLTVSNTNTSAATAAVWLSSLGVGAGSANNIVRNLNISCGADQSTGTNSTYGIIMCGTSISTTSNGDDNDNNQFLYNNITKCRYGITTRGVTTNLNQGIVVSYNTVGPTAFGSNEIGKVGIYMQADQGAIVSYNTVQFVGGQYANTTGGADRVGIAIGTESWSTAPSTITSNTYVVTNNIIHDVIEERTFSAVGLLLATTGGGSATNNLVANNFIYNIRANGTAGDQTVGLGIAGGHTDNVVFNTIYLSGDVDPNPSASATSNYGSGIRIANTNGTTHLNLTLKNNIVYMDLSSSSAATVRYYAISGNSASYTFGTGGENNNAYYINPANTQLQTGGLGSSSGVTLTTQFATLANWQAAYTVPQDANSIAAQPLFVSATDLHMQSSGANAPFNGTGAAIAGVTTDFDGEARGGSPDMGADEFNIPTCVTASGGTIAPGTASVCAGLTYAMSATGATSGDGISYQWEVSTIGGGAGFSNVTGGTGATTVSYTTGALTAGTYYYRLRVTCTPAAVTGYSNELTLTVNPTPTASASSNSPVCEGAAINLLGTTDIGTTYSWTGPAGYSSSSEDPTIASAALTNAGTYTFTASFGGCTSTPATTVVTVNPNPSGVVATASPTPVCEGADITLTASANPLGYVMNTAGTETFIDISVSGTSVGTLGDDSEYNVTIPAFNFNGVSYTSARVGNNGAIALGSTTGEISNSNAALPSTANSAGNVLLLPWWDDLDIDFTGEVISTQTVGSKYIIQYSNMSHFSYATGGVTFQIQLDLVSGAIHYVYNDVIFGSATYDAGVTATVGLQYSSTSATQYSFNTASLSNGQCITFTPSLPSFSWTGPDGFTSALQNPTVTGATAAAAGVYTVTVTNATTGCSTVASTASVAVLPNTTYYADADSDTYGDATTSQLSCTGAPAGYVLDNTDCDDASATVNPAATEVCANGIDDDCDGSVDEFCTIYTFYEDSDGDTYGNPAVSVTNFTGIAPAGYVADNTDCDDTDAAINPAATEICDGVDNDCDGSIDEAGATGESTWFADADSDGFGDPLVSVTACTSPAGYVGANDDCDDTNAAINPGATEICNGIDDDCDGSTDEGVLLTFYADTDSDTYGDAASTTTACTAPIGYVADNTDCNDANAAVNPGATEICNGIDDDCDGSTDEGLVFITYYADADGDGFGNAAISSITCDGAPAGYVTDNTDCNDASAAAYPGATEICDGIDNDCDGSTDEGLTYTTYYADFEGDGFGDPWNTTSSCSPTPPTGYVTDNSDCQPFFTTYPDLDGDGYGGAVAVPCGPVINNADCDDTQWLYQDHDGDGYGAYAPVECGVPTNTDCEPFNAAINPGATEVCDGIDNDCDGVVDDGVTTTYYADVDGDLYGDPATATAACTAPVGYITTGGDCNDADAAINPAATEVCDGIDNDCDGSVDEGVLLTFYADADSDTYGDAASSTLACAAPVGYVTDNTDCNDADAAINPAATEVCDGVDNDCDGSVDEGVLLTFYADADSDTYGDAASTTLACAAPTGYVANNTDCNDADAAVNPGATEICNGIDDDCDGVADDGLTFLDYYADADGDGYGDAAATAVNSCSPVAGSVTNNGDCNDADAAVNPAATEVCDGIDNDCDGSVDEGVLLTFYADADGDTFGDAAVSVTACAAPVGYVANSTDCDDTNATIPAGPLNGSYTVPSACFPTIASAVTSLNTLGISGAVTFNVTAGHSETAPTGGIALTATGTITNTITFQKSGAGANPVINAFVGTSTPGSANQDGIFRLVGSDYVTIDGINLNDGNAANPATMEYGYGLFKASATDGAQNNTIKNSTITLNRINNATGSGPAVDGSRGINMVNSTAAAQTTALTVTAASGANSNNKFYSNTIQNCNIGIAAIGYADASPYANADTGNDIGGASAATGNTIKNYGGAAGATNAAAGIRTLAQYGLNVSYNTINNNDGGGVNHPSTLRGIYTNTAANASMTISNNTVTLNGGGTTSQLSAIENVAGGSGVSNIVNITNNTVQNSTYSTATTGTFLGIYNNVISGGTATFNINNNIVANNTLPGTGAFTGMDGGSAGTTTVVNMNNNQVYGNTKTGASGSQFGIRAGTVNITMNGNTVRDNSFTANSGTSSSLLYGIYNLSSPINEVYTNNTVYNLSINGANTSTSNVIYAIYSFTVSTSVINMSGNTVYNITFNNSSTGACAINGIRVSSGGTTNVFRNKIYDITSNGASSTADGIRITGGTTHNVYNNLIGNISTPTANAAIPLSGIQVSGGTTANVSYNTVHLNASSTGALFGSAAMYASTTPTVTLRNNIFVNNSTPVGATGYTAAYRRTSTTLTSYGAASNNNMFYAGTPGTNRVIYFDGTTTQQTLANYQALVTTRDNASVTENPTFASLVGANADFLHFAAGASTLAESYGVNIAGITDDFDTNVRQGNPGYAGAGIAPDMGADEFEGVNPLLFPIDAGATALVNPLAGATCFTNAETVTVTIKNYGYLTLDMSINPVTVTTTITGPVGATLNATVNTGTLAPGATLNVNMTGTIDMMAPGVYTFNASTAVAGDGNAGNDAMAAATRTSNNPTVTLAAASPVCEGDVITLTATAAGGSLDGTYTGTNTTPVSILDNSLTGASSTITLAGPVASVGATTQLQVGLNVSGTWNSDIDAYLVGPAGCGTIELTTDNGGSADGFNITLYSTGAYPSVTTLPATGTPTGNYLMEGTVLTSPATLSGTGGVNYPSVVYTALNGCPVNGTWTLFAGDDASGDSHTIQNWSLTVIQPGIGVYTDAFTGPGTFGTTTYSGANNSTATTTVTGLTPGTYTFDVVATDVNGCNSAPASTTVTVLANTTYYADADGDGFGDAAVTALSCTGAPAGYVTDNTDCNDASATVYPGATEICGNGIDDDCDGSVDELCTLYTFYADADGDTYGNAAVSVTNFTGIAPVGYVADNTDCDDTNASVNPAATEICNGIDDDCDGSVDEGLTFLDYYTDADGDGYGDFLAAPVNACSPVAGAVTNNDDCNDSNNLINPAGTEICNGVDDDCDGIVDDGITYTFYYADADSDGYGDPLVVISTCDGPPAGYVADNTDCNDASAAVNPGATEVCNGIDDDCDGSIDEGLVFTTYYADVDGDGFGDAFNTTTTCDGMPAGYVTDNTDCDDTQNTVYPGATEICDGFDNDCDGEFDEGTVTATITPSGLITICKGVPTPLNANTGVGYTYQWFKNGNVIFGATASVYNVTKPGYYQVQVNSPEGCFALSAVTTVQVYPNPNANISAPTGTSLCATVKLKASYDATYTWQWYKDGSPVAGATSYLYFPTVAGNYYCAITNNFGCVRNTATLTVTACKEGEGTSAAIEESFDMYPNPTESIFTLDMEINTTEAEAQVYILNLIGEQVYGGVVTIDHGTVNSTIQLGDEVPSGMYIVKVLVADKEYTKQLVIQK